MDSVTLQKVRDAVADKVAETHGNPEFIRQIRSGEQDDGPYMVGGLAVAADPSVAELVLRSEWVEGDQNPNSEVKHGAS